MTNPEPASGAPKNIYARILDVMREVAYVQKDPRKVNNQYRFVSHDAVVAKIHEAVVKCGIAVISSVVPESIKRDGNRCELILRTRFINPDDPSDMVEVFFPGEGIDPQDKGLGKAMSYAVKYTFLKVFLLETGDDPENDDIDHAPTDKPAPLKMPQPKPLAAKTADDGKLPLERALMALEAAKTVEELGTAFRFWATKDRPKPFVDTLTAKAAARKAEITAGFDAPLPSEARP